MRLIEKKLCEKNVLLDDEIKLICKVVYGNDMLYMQKVYEHNIQKTKKNCNKLFEMILRRDLKNIKRLAI